MKLLTLISSSLLGIGLLAAQPAAALSLNVPSSAPVQSASSTQLDTAGSNLVQEAGFKRHRGRGFRSRGFRNRGFHRGYNRGFRGRHHSVNRKFRGHRGSSFRHHRFGKFHHRKFRRF